jgi:hypothetical protein
MKQNASLILFLILLIWTSPVIAFTGTDKLYLSISIVRGERGRDSHSRNETITLKGMTIVYDKTYSGFRASRFKAKHGEYKITEEEHKTLTRIIKEKNLLMSASSEYPSSNSGISRYFEITANLRSNRKSSQIRISTATNDTRIREEKLYQATDALVKEIYRILNNQDKEIEYKDFVD